MKDSNLGAAGPETSDFLIYGQVVCPVGTSADSLPSSSKSEPEVLQMYAARILPGPPPPTARPPRPDDPTPRKPPAHLLNAGSKRKRDLSSASLSFGGGVKRSKSSYLGVKPEDEDETIRRAREVMLRGPPPPDKFRGRAEVDVFKIPPLPMRSASENLGASQSSDVFGSVTSLNNGKGKARELRQDAGSNELEKANKMVMSLAMQSLKHLIGF